MSATQSALSTKVKHVMARLTEAGGRLAPDGPNLRIWSPDALAVELRELVVAHKQVILAALSVWCPKRAVLLEQEADGLVADLGVDGTDSEIVAAAERCVAAHYAKDMAGVRIECFKIEARARQLAG